VVNSDKKGASLMPSIRCRAWSGKSAAVGAACAAVAGILALSGPALAAPAHAKKPKPGTNLLFNGDFAKPGPVKHEGVAPTGWALVDLGVEKKPFGAAIGVYNAKGKYPPPKGNPNKADVADEAFYEGGSSLGVEGIGGEQTAKKFGSITQANNPQLSFSTVEHSAPEEANDTWAGSGIQINFTSGKKAYSLIYLYPWTTTTKPPYSAKPVNSATAKYILEKPITFNKWVTLKPVSLSTGIQKQFKVKSYKITDVIFVDLENTVNSGSSPYPNMDGYFADLALTEGKA
jgi:hypothetical protein